MLHVVAKNTILTGLDSLASGYFPSWTGSIEVAQLLLIYRLERPGKTYSFADCTSFVLMRRLGITRAATLDADFAREGFEVLPSL